MAIKFPDSITQNNANYITVSASDGDVQGIYFVDTVAERDAIGLADISLDNHRHLSTVVFVGSAGYVYNGPSLTDVAWQDATNWISVGSGSATLAGLSDVDLSGGVAAGDALIYDGTNFVPANTALNVLVSTDTASSVDSFAIADYSSAIYSYSLSGSHSRTGQVYLDYDDLGNLELTDISTNPQGTDSNPPEFQAAVSSGTHIVLQVVNGNGYSFKAQVTRL